MPKQTIRRSVRCLLVSGLALIILNIFIHFPYHYDVLARPAGAKAYRQFYGEVYSPPEAAPAEAEDQNYVAIGREAIKDFEIVARIRAFVEKYGLQDKRVLDVGAGTGYLQDIVKDYVGLDISPTARRFFHKPYVEASATDMPFPDGTFDGLWSIWVLEHVPTPEQALLEMRRVAKDGALLFLLPAWSCSPWAADGYPVRPYSDFGLNGKLIKAGVPILESRPFRATYHVPIRVLRLTYAKLSGAPTRFHYVPLSPNYSHYWMSDSDAINSLDRVELMLWFTSRGDECLNCGPREIVGGGNELIIRVHKNAPSTN